MQSNGRQAKGDRNQRSAWEKCQKSKCRATILNCNKFHRKQFIGLLMLESGRFIHELFFGFRLQYLVFSFSIFLCVSRFHAFYCYFPSIEHIATKVIQYSKYGWTFQLILVNYFTVHNFVHIKQLRFSHLHGAYEHGVTLAKWEMGTTKKEKKNEIY